MNFAKAGVAVTTAVIATIVDITLDGEAEAAFSFKNNSANAWNAFEIHAAFAKGGALVPLATIAGDLSTPLWPLRRADALVTLGAGLTGKVFMNTQGIYRLVFKAKVATADSTADVYGQIV